VGSAGLVSHSMAIDFSRAARRLISPRSGGGA